MDENFAGIDATMELAWSAFQAYRELPRKRRWDFMHAIAEEIEALGDHLLETANSETHLPLSRLAAERARTCWQLRSYADACLRGNHLDIRIDTADASRIPPKPGLRKMNLPLGPVIVFGASNFPFAYSTAGGDTACAFAAGCTVVVKAHPAHPRCSDLVAGAILRAASKTGMPDGVFGHVHGAGNETGAALVRHPHSKAVGFTGSFSGGKALFDIANSRPDPIPVFAEMGSVNPVFLLPEQLAMRAEDFARQLAASITLSVGQFCTNPGVLVGMQGPDLDRFAATLSTEIRKSVPETMLHPGISASFRQHRSHALAQEEVQVLAESTLKADVNQGIPTLATVEAAVFLRNPALQTEVFGPYSILVQCQDIAQMRLVAKALRGQISSTLIATPTDITANPDLVATLQEGCGRLIMNGVPTGVEVVLAQHHGGPYPATTDGRYTAVGADGIRRFVRPLAFQNWEDALLPPELQDANPEGLWRTINNLLTKDSIL